MAIKKIDDTPPPSPPAPEAKPETPETTAVTAPSAQVEPLPGEIVATPAMTPVRAQLADLQVEHDRLALTPAYGEIAAANNQRLMEVRHQIDVLAAVRPIEATWHALTGEQRAALMAQCNADGTLR